MGLAKRRLFKPERRPARKKGVIGKLAPIDCPDASQPEVVSALAHLCGELGIRVGRGGEYDALRDEYTVIAKVLDGSVHQTRHSGKVKDVRIAGWLVAGAIFYARCGAMGRHDLFEAIRLRRFSYVREQLGAVRYDRPMTWAS